MKRLVDGLKWISDFFCDFAGAGLFFLMTMTMVDIIGRNLGLWSVRGIIEMSTMSVIFIGFLALPSAYLQNKHIVIDLLSGHLPAAINNLLDRLWLVIGAILLAAASYLMWRATIRVSVTNELSPDLHLPMVWFWVAGSVGLTLSTFASLVMGIRDVTHGRT
jgi:TRAP-type transport system small permease protein